MIDVLGADESGIGCLTIPKMSTLVKQRINYKSADFDSTFQNILAVCTINKRITACCLLCTCTELQRASSAGSI